jgi:hypothetical protein
MKRPVLILAAVALLLVVGGAVFFILFNSTAPAPAAVTTASASVPTNEAYQRLQRENADLRAKLADAEKKDQEIVQLKQQLAQQQPASQEQLEQVVIPRTPEEMGKFAGNLRSRWTAFQKEFPNGAPKENSPEYARYIETFQSLMADMAIMQAKRDQFTAFNASDSAKFQASLVGTALGMDDARIASLQTLLGNAYSKQFADKLDWQSRPQNQDGVDDQTNRDAQRAWFEKRRELGRQTAEQLTATLTPAQKTQFDEMFGDDAMSFGRMGNRGGGGWGGGGGGGGGGGQRNNNGGNPQGGAQAGQTATAPAQ